MAKVRSFHGLKHVATIIVTGTERENYQVEIQISPSQESYEIGSQLTINCTATPSPGIYQNFKFPLVYQWYYPDRRSYPSSTNTWTYTISSREQSGNYYWLIYSSNSNNLLGQPRITLNLEAILFYDLTIIEILLYILY